MRESCPQVEVLWEHGLSAMTFIDGGWEIGCDGGKIFRAALVVGADGARSRVRELTAMPVRQWSYDQSAIVGTVALAHHLDSCWQAFLDTGPLALYPLPMTAKSPWSGRWMTRRIRLLPKLVTRRSCGH